jgi:ribosomal protein S18 acetylase RimI-like enzyme
VELLINPPLDDVRPALLESLNRCFPNWGDDDDFRWHLVRTVGGRKTDVMLVKDEHRFVAGSAVVYRPVRLRTGEIAEVGIMASSWTLPEARGHGHFSRIIETSVELARKNGVALLTAYVTSTNASARRLLASGAAGYPTHYLIGDGSPPAAAGSIPAVVEATEALLEEVMDASPPHANVARFVYTPQEWREQFWTRPDVVRTLRVGTIGTALVETRNDFDRLLAFSNTGEDGADCLAPLIAWSHARGQKFFFFTTEDGWRDRAVRLGMRHLPGFLTAMESV